MLQHEAKADSQLLKLRMQTARTAALAADVALLKQEVAVLRSLLNANPSAPLETLVHSQLVRSRHSQTAVCAEPMTAPVAAPHCSYSTVVAPLPEPVQNAPSRSPPRTSTTKFSNKSATVHNVNSHNHPELTPWTSVVRQLYPGHLTTLSPASRIHLNNLTHSFLLRRLPNPTVAESCRIALSKGGNIAPSLEGAAKTYYAIPKNLLEEFRRWIVGRVVGAKGYVAERAVIGYESEDEEIDDENIKKDDWVNGGRVRESAHMGQSHAHNNVLQHTHDVQNEFSTGAADERRISAPQYQPYSTTQNGSNFSSAVPFQHQHYQQHSHLRPLDQLCIASRDILKDYNDTYMSYPDSTQNSSSIRQSSDLPSAQETSISATSDPLLDLRFPIPPPAFLPNGTPNKAEFRAWTDVIRSKHPTFQRATPPMSKQARVFLRDHKIPLQTLVPATSLRTSKATFAIPRVFYGAFLSYMQDTFLREGVFGEKFLHSLVARRIAGGGPGWEEEEVQSVVNSQAVEDLKAGGSESNEGDVELEEAEEVLGEGSVDFVGGWNTTTVDPSMEDEVPRNEMAKTGEKRSGSMDRDALFHDSEILVAAVSSKVQRVT